MLIDPNAHYLESHEWVRAGGDGVAVGLSAYAIAQLGDIVYMKLPEVGQALTPGQAFGVIESVKSAMELHAPAAGTVVEVNTAVCDNPDSLKRDAYEKGWLVRLKPAEAAPFDGLMDADAYRTYLESSV